MNMNESDNMEMPERVARIEAKLDAILPTLATKEELHKALHEQTWKMFGAASVLVAVTYFIARYVHP